MIFGGEQAGDSLIRGLTSAGAGQGGNAPELARAVPPG